MKQIPLASLKFLRTFLCFSLTVVGAYSSASSLNFNQGNLTDLFPDKVNDYKRIKIVSGKVAPGKEGNLPLGLMPHKERLGYIEDAGAAYVSSTNKAVIIQAIKFSPPENAKEALQIFKKDPAPSVELKEVGEKKKGSSTVGERVVIIGTNSKGEERLVNIWTNGSLLFILRAQYPEQSGNFVAPNATDLREFENSFPY
jgi:hypothetical protein